MQKATTTTDKQRRHTVVETEAVKQSDEAQSQQVTDNTRPTQQQRPSQDSQ